MLQPAKTVGWVAVVLLLMAMFTTALTIATIGDTRVADAAMKGDKDAVRTLVKQAADVNAAQGDGMTALHWAALNGDAATAEVLLHAGANVKATTRLGGYTPLYFASKAGSAPVIDLILKAGADPRAATPLGLTPLMMAATSGNVDAVSVLLKAGSDPNAAELEHGQNALSFAAAFNRPDVIKALAKSGANLDLASKVIVPAPAAPRGQGGQGGQGQAPPAAAAGAGRGAAPPAAAAGGQAAAANGQQAAAMNGADGAGRGGGNNKGGLTPLMYAARQGNMEAVMALLDSGAKLDPISADKSTALLLASINAHFDIAKVLVEHGANVSIASVDGASPLYGMVNVQWARHSGYPQPQAKYETTSYLDLMKLMLDHGADSNARIAKELWYSEYNFGLESASAAGTTAFWKCAEVGDIDGMKLLVSRGADPHIASLDGVTPFLMASGAGTHGNDDVSAPPGRLAAVKYLVEELHVDVNEADTGGGGRVEFAAATIPAPASATPGVATAAGAAAAVAQGPGRGGAAGGFTALHNAANRGDNAMILYLVSKGAKVDAMSKNGTSVADMANGPRQRIQPYPATVALLEMLGSHNSHRCVSC